MKKLFLFVSILVSCTIYIANANAGICFIVGDCGMSRMPKSCALNKAKYNVRVCETGLIPGGDYCYSSGAMWYEKCVCDISYYRWTKEDLGNSYEAREPKTCDDEVRYRYRVCRPEYKYVDGSIPYSYNAGKHNNVMVCGAGAVGDSEEGYCVENDALNHNGVAFNRYKSCKCPTPLGTEWKKCNDTGELPDNSSNSTCTVDNVTYYRNCLCQEGYRKENGKCVHNNGGWATNDQCRAATGGCCKYDASLKYWYATTCVEEEKYDGRYVLYFTKSAPDMEKLRTRFNKHGFVDKQKGGKVAIAKIETIDNEVQAKEKLFELAEKENILEAYQINIHPMFSYAGYSENINDSSEWGIDLGIDLPRPIKEFGNAYNQDTFDIPFLMKGNIHTGEAYANLCGSSGERQVFPYDYAGWLSGLYYWSESSDSSSVNEPLVAGHYRPGIGKGCHPDQFNAYKDYQRYDILSFTSQVEQFGGDKCVNYVFKKNAKDIYIPSIVLDTEMKIAYLIVQDPRFMVTEREYVEDKFWQAEGTTESGTDWRSNFLVWEDYNNLGKEQICVDKAEEYKFFHREDINTYPYLNRMWTNEVTTGNVVWDNGMWNLRHNPVYDTTLGKGKTVWNNFIGDYEAYLNAYNYQNNYESNGDGYVEDWYWRKYYHDNEENIVNGKYPWSYPYAFDEGESDYTWSSPYDIR